MQKKSKLPRGGFWGAFWESWAATQFVHLGLVLPLAFLNAKCMAALTNGFCNTFLFAASCRAFFNLAVFLKATSDPGCTAMAE